MTVESGAENCFESFINETYPYHAKRLRKARKIVRFSIIKGVLSSFTYFGAPICGLVFLAKHLIVNHSASLQEGQRPIPFVEHAEPASQIAMIAVLVTCTISGAIAGFLKKQKFGLQIEQDELGLRTDFMLRELARDQASNSGMTRAQSATDDEFVLRNPKSTDREKIPMSYPPLSRISGNKFEGPAVTGNDFSEVSFIEQPRRR